MPPIDRCRATRGNSKPKRSHSSSDTAIGLELTDAARDYIHLYRGDSTALAQSLDRIQRTASAILATIGNGG